MMTAKKPRVRIRQNPLYVELPGLHGDWLRAIVADESSAERAGHESCRCHRRDMVREEFQRRLAIAP